MTIHALPQEDPSFPDLVDTAVRLARTRPAELRALLLVLDPFEGPRLYFELLRIARGATPPRRMSRALREMLPHIVEGLGPPAPATIH
jgi:hypothetical protein